MSGNTGGAGGYQAIKEMIGMYALLICSLFSIFFQMNRILAVAKNFVASETFELEELHWKVSIC